MLYLLDGETLFHQAVGAVRHFADDDVLPLIVVGIVNTERTRDLTPPAAAVQLADFPTAGGSAAFRRFLVDELIPFVDRTYRTGGVGILAGHSFGGLFAAETLLLEPEAFKGYLCMSPSLWWNDQALVESCKALPDDHAMWDRFAWFTVGDEDGGLNAAFEAGTWALRERAPARFRWGREHFRDHDHWAAALPALGSGLRAYLRPLQEVGRRAETWEELVAQAEEVAEAFDIDRPLGRRVVADAARRLAKNGDTGAALKLLGKATAEIDDDPFLFYVWAEILGSAGSQQEAIAILEGAISRFGVNPRHAYDVGWLRRRLAALKSDPTKD